MCYFESIQIQVISGKKVRFLGLRRENATLTYRSVLPKTRDAVFRLLPWIKLAV
ncbi:Bifunctional glutamine synthetase adenylyltransferase/adenylyl-removing enzyme [Dirofilaria immitis]